MIYVAITLMVISGVLGITLGVMITCEVFGLSPFDIDIDFLARIHPPQKEFEVSTDNTD